MADMRSGPWAFWGVAVLSGVVACVDGTVPASQGTSSSGGNNESVTGASGKDGASGKGVGGASSASMVTCMSPQVSCNGVCSDLTSAAHCGSCEQVCATGQSCVAGSCMCPGTQSACNGVCVDTQTSVEHCGGCSKPCATGAACSAGVCGCAMNQQLCNGVCVDLKQSDANCGACGKACTSGQVCANGSCVAGAGADGCMGGPALGITLKHIDVYQSVKVPVMDAGAEITADKRTTDVVSGRPTMFRLAVALTSGFTARQLSGRVTIDNGTTAAQFFAKVAVSKDSVDTDAASTFQIVVPAEQITPDAHYSAELVECGAGSGQAGSARFPQTGDIALGARHTGGLKVNIIPLQANNKLPDTSDTALAIYQKQMLAMYPIDAITFTVGAPVTVAYPIDWEGTLDQLRAKRKTDAAPADVYYYGMLKPQDTFSAFCGNACTTGIGFVGEATSGGYRAAMGVGYADRVSAQTMAHEIGHNHGRNHAPCVPNGGSISGVDPKYPFPDGRTGIIGWDSRTNMLLSEKGTDLMGYCSNVWLSEYTYGGLTDRVALVNGNKSQVLNAAALQTFRVLLLGGQKGPRWGIPITTPSLPEGTPVSARVFDDAGNFLQETTVYRTEISDSGAASIMVPEPQPGWSAIDVAGSGALPFAP
ncbi:MAG TPA: zinc-dependent metalloprotease family protein [Polyangiaceae bacterium]|nr:zinc-dependent metalloprotease family protein [Polyangiaceae bacterium]